MSIGPYATIEDLHGSREIIPYSSNATASYVSTIYLGNGFESTERNTDGSLKLERQFCSLPVERISKKYLVSYELDQVAESIKQDIENHIEMRLQLFLLQIMLVFQSNLNVHQFRTQSQAGDQKKGGAQTGTSFDPVEVHAGTLPNLIACKKEEEENRFISVNIELKPRILAKDTSFYKQANITHKLPRFVNDTDSDIDFRTTELENLCETFRDRCVSLLTFASTNRLANPQLSFRYFLDRIRKKLEILYPSSPSYQQRVLLYYQGVVGSYLIQNEDPNFIKRLMFDRNLDFPGIANSIRQKMENELLILSRIAAIQTACKGLLSPQNFDAAIKCLLVLSTDGGRLALLLKKVKDLSDTQEEYYEKALSLPSVADRARQIIQADTELSWVEDPSGLDTNFVNLVKDELKKAFNKTTIQKCEAIALKILWAIAKEQQIASEKAKKLYIFLTIDPGQALYFMRKHPALRRNVMACLHDPAIQPLVQALLDSL